MSSAKKATIYVDVDDEITTLIDKLTQAPEKIVALVLPKRATMLQSIVNMKLLKRSADNAKKKIVLITSEGNILPLAGAVGVHVAKTLQSQPTLPAAPVIESDVPEDAAIDDIDIDKTAPIGKLAGSDDEETALVPEAEGAEKSTAAAAGAKKKNKLKIPNFNKFRLRLILAAVVLLLLIGGWVVATRVLPKADILIKTNSKTFTKNLNITASLEQAAVDIENQIAPAKTEQIEKKDSESVPATGEKNVGKKAEGTMTLTNCIDDGEEHTVPGGTSFTRSGKTFVTTESVTLDFAVYAGNNCVSDQLGRSEDVDVVAAEGGTSYNIKEGSYTSSIAGIDAYGSNMKGGTDQLVKVVSQQDIDSARDALRQKTSEGTVEDLQALLEGQGYVPFESTYDSGEPVVTQSVEPGTEAESVTVTSTTVYSMTGVLKQALDELVTEATSEDIDRETQIVTATGIETAVLRITESRPDGTFSISVETLVTAGPQLNEANILQDILGKKRGETQSIIESKAGVSEVEINYSPFWVHATPNNEDKVTITIENVSESTEEPAEEESTEDDATSSE